MVPFQGTSSPKRMNFLHCLIVKAKALRRFETSGTSGPAKKNGLRGLLDLEVVFFLYLLILTYCLLLLLFSSRILLFLSSSIPSLDLPYVFPSLILSFHFALFSSVFPASLLLSPFLLINYLTPPRVVSGSGAISVLRNVPSSATVISEVVKLTVEFLATLFLLQTTDSRSLAFKAGFLQFLHSWFLFWEQPPVCIRVWLPLTRDAPSLLNHSSSQTASSLICASIAVCNAEAASAPTLTVRRCVSDRPYFMMFIFLRVNTRTVCYLFM